MKMSYDQKEIIKWAIVTILVIAALFAGAIWLGINSNENPYK